jgi:hypothetical protein
MRRFAMRFPAWLAAAGLSLGLLATPTSIYGEEKAKEAGGCSGHGTIIDFYDTPSQAATQAVKKEKLVFVLHVSGNFEDPRFT